MNGLKSVKYLSLSVVLYLLFQSNLLAQCPELLTEVSDPDCEVNCSVCLGDEITFTLTGDNMIDGTEIEWFINNNGDDPASGTMIGTSPITADCEDGPQAMYVLIDPPPGPDRCDEYIVLYTGGSGFNTEDIDVLNSGGNPIGPYVLGNTAAFDPDCVLTAVGPGDFIPDDAILIIQTSAVGLEVYDISELCNLGLDIYVTASDNIDCGGGFFFNSGDQTFTVELGCTSDIISYGGSANAWSYVDGTGNWITEVPAMPIPDPSPGVTTIDDFTFEVTQDIIDDFCTPPSVTLDIQGYLNPQSGGCSDVETIVYNLTLSCPEAMTPDPIEACDMGGNLTLDLTMYNNDVSGGAGTVVWSNNSDGSGIIANPSNYVGNGPVYAAVESGGCTSNIVELVININPEPTAMLSIDPDPACEGEDITIFEDGGDGVSWMWDGPGGYNSMDQDADVPNAAGGIYTVTVTDANDCTTTAEIEFDPLPGPQATVDVSNTTLCDGSCIEVTFEVTNGGGGPYDLTWEIDAGITFPFPWTATDDNETWTICTGPGLFPTWDDGTNTATVPNILTFINVTLIEISENGCVGQVNSDVISIDIIDLPTANSAGPLEACAMGGMDASFDLSSLEGTIGGGEDVIWYETEDLLDEIFSPFETDVTVSVWAVVFDGDCYSEPIEIMLIVAGNNDAGEDGELEFCEGEQATQDLFGALMGTPDLGGTWSDESGASVNLSNPNAVDFSGVAAGDYIFNYAFATVDPCIGASAEVLVIINGLPQIELGDEECTPDNLFYILNFSFDDPVNLFSNVGVITDLGGGNYQVTIPISETDFTLNMTNLITGCFISETFQVPDCGCGIISNPDVLEEYIVCPGDDFPLLDADPDPGLEVNWLDDMGNVILANSNTFTPLMGGIFGVVIYDPADPTCESQVIEFEVILELEGNPGTNTILQICQGTTQSFDIFALMEGMPDIGGMWEDDLLTGVDLTDPTNVVFDILPEGVYDFSYTLNSINCNTVGAPLTVVVFAAPNPGMDIDTVFCSSMMSTINLFDLNATAEVGGIWSDPTMLLDLTDPLAVDFSILPPGFYSIDYTFAVSNTMNPYCDQAESTIDFEIIEQPNAGLDNNSNICIGGDVDLIDFLISNTTIGTFESMNPLIDLMGGTTFPTATLMTGTYEFYHIVAMTAECPADTALLSLTLSDQLTAGQNVNEILCPVGNLDLSTLLDGGDPGGVFTNLADNTTIIGGTIDLVDFAGQMLMIDYQVGGGTCPIDNALLTLSIIETPSITLSPNVSQLCSGDCIDIMINAPTGQLADLVFNILDESGGIAVANETLILNGNTLFEVCNTADGILNLNNLEADQNYSIELISANFENCVFDISEIVDFTTVSPGTLNYSATLCENESVMFGSETFNVNNPSGSVVISEAGACDSLINVDLSFNPLAEGFIDGVVCGSFVITVGSSIYGIDNPTGVEVLTGASELMCDSIVYVDLEFEDENEVFELVENLCEGESIMVGGEIFNEANPMGQVIIPAVSEFDCDSTVNVTLTFEEAYFFTTVEPCPGDDEMTIVLEGNNSENLPILFTIDNQMPITVNALPFEFELIEGNYLFNVIDTENCMTETGFNVELNTSFNFNINSSIISENVYQLSTDTNLQLDSVEWLSTTNLDCTLCFTSATGMISDSVEIIAIAYFGDDCELRDTIRLVEIKNYDIVTPNIFSPDGNGVNDNFFIQTEEPLPVRSLLIYDRWGSLVFTNSNFMTSDISQGWDGRFNGKKVLPGVYVFVLELTLADGSEDVINGSITIVR